MLTGSVRKRVVKEQKQLSNKINKLMLFVQDFSKIKNVSDYELDLLKKQLNVMVDYEEILTKRLEAD